MADRLVAIFKERYGIDVKAEVSNVASDTTPSATNVADYLGTDQDNCNMHILSLILGYSLGVKENTKTVKVTGDNGTVHKETSIVTKGGPFREGKRIVKVAKKVVNYFGGSPQREKGLIDIRKQFTYPSITLQNPADTRVGYVIVMVRTILANVYLLNKMVGTSDDFDKVWGALYSQDPNSIHQDLRAMQEMEAVCKTLADYALTNAQKSKDHDSHLLPMYRQMVKNIVDKTEFKVMRIGNRVSPNATLKYWPREIRQVSDFTDKGKKCFERLRHQMSERLPPLESRQCMATLLDPTTKLFAKVLLTAESATLYEETRSMLKLKHQEVYNLIHRKESNEPNGEAAVGTAAADADGDELLAEPTVMDSDDEDDILMSVADEAYQEQGAEVDDLNTEADAQFDKWMAEVPTWNKYLLEDVPQIKEKELRLKDVIGKFDTRKYYREYASDKYPAISMLARIHFSRMDNAAFQERVFSTAASAQSKNQANMAFNNLEKRTLLQANRELIREGIIKV